MTAKEERPGTELERLVAMLEAALANTGAKIEAPCRRLKDRDTGEHREHDVVITWDHGHHQLITAIECRDRSRPVGVPDVEAFADKCRSTGVHQGVVVSAKGFRDTARRKAASRSITCMDLKDVGSFDWLAVDSIIRYERHFVHMSVGIIFENEQPNVMAAIFDTDGTQLTNEQIQQTIISAIPFTDDPESDVGISRTVKVHAQTERWTASDQNGCIWPISHMLVDATYTTTKTASPVSSHRYVGGGKDYSIASAEAQLGDQAGRMMLVRNDDGTTTVSWAPDNHGKGKAEGKA